MARPADLLGDDFVQRDVDCAARVRMFGWRDVDAGHEFQIVTQLARRQGSELDAVLRRIIVFQGDEKGGVGCHIARHAPRRGVEIALEEDVGNDRLQQKHRRNDDDERTAEQPARHETLEETSRPQPRQSASDGFKTHCREPERNPRREPSADRAEVWGPLRSCA